MTDEVETVDAKTVDAVESVENAEPVAPDQGLLSKAELNTGVDESTQPDNVEGETQSERPDFIGDRFWNKETKEVNLEALAKSQKDFEKMARGKVGDLPKDADEYILNAPEGFEGDINEDPFVASAKELAFKHGLPRDQFEGFMGDLLEQVQANAAPAIDIEAEKAKLGSRADNVIEAVNGWMDGLSEKGLLSEQEHEAMLAIGNTAEGVKALNKIRTHYTRGETIPTQISTEDGAMSADEYYKAVASDRYSEDATYRNSVKKQATRIFGNQPAGSSVRGLGV